MIVTIINKTTGQTKSVNGNFEVLADVYDHLDGLGENIMPINSKIINRTDNRTVIFQNDRLIGGNDIELHVYPGKIDAGA